MTSPSLWTELEKNKPASPLKTSLWTDLKKDESSLPSKTPRSKNLFKLLDKRADVENTRPHVIKSAIMEMVGEDDIPDKSKGVTTKVNLLNSTTYVVTNPKTNQYFQLNEKEKFLWDHMDGRHTIRDLALEYFNAYGAFAYDAIVELVTDLKTKTFLTEEYIDIYSELNQWSKSREVFYRIFNVVKRFLYWDFPLQRVDGFFEWLYTSFFKIFFNKVAGIFLLVIAGLGVVSFMIESQSEKYSLLHANNSIVGGIALLFLINFISLFIHEIAHGIATKHYGRSVHKAGFLLYFGTPSFYVDTTDMWMEDEKNRIMVSLIGPFTAVLIGGIVSLCLLFFPTLHLSALLYKFAFVSYLSFFLNLNPLVEWDGYFVLMDLLRIPCLRRRSFYFIQTSLWHKLRSRESFNREEVIYTIFGIGAAIWTVIAIFLGLEFWRIQVARFF